MENVVDKITGQQLSDLGIESKDSIPKKRETPVKTVVKAKPVQAKMFDEMPDIPDFLDRRRNPDNRQLSYIPKTSRAPEPTGWAKDDVIAKLDVLRQEAFECIEGSPDAVIYTKDLDKIVNILATDVANAMEHAGLVYSTAGSPERLRELLHAFIVSDTKHNNGSMYRYLAVSYDKAE